MKSLLVAAMFASIASVAIAQTAAPTPTPTPMPTPAALATPAPAAAADAKLTGKEVREQCKSEAKAQGLKGPARKAAVDQCFAQARPDLAKAQQCRKEGKAKGLADKDLKAYVKQCKTAG